MKAALILSQPSDNIVTLLVLSPESLEAYVFCTTEQLSHFFVIFHYSNKKFIINTVYWDYNEWCQLNVHELICPTYLDAYSDELYNHNMRFTLYSNHSSQANHARLLVGLHYMTTIASNSYSKQKRAINSILHILSFFI